LSELRKYQAKVLVASSAEEAINSIQQQTVDVLLVEHILPRESAFDLTAAIPSGSTGMTKVLMTKHPLTSADLTKAAEMGIDAVLERPLGREKLKEVLQKVFKRCSIGSPDENGSAC
jgi:DNA-binding response OmpR family regulator